MRKLVSSDSVLEIFSASYNKCINNIYLQQLNEILAEKFDRGDNIDGLMATSDEILLPCLSQMKNTAFKDDDTAVEEIGNRWCAFLGQDLSSEYNI